MIVYRSTDYQSETTVTAIPEELLQPESAGSLSSASCDRLLILRSGQSELFLCSRIRENSVRFCSRTRESSVRFRGRHPNSHESGYSQHTLLTG